MAYFLRACPLHTFGLFDIMNGAITRDGPVKQPVLRTLDFSFVGCFG